MNKFIFNWLFAIVGLFTSFQIQCEEIDKGLVILDKKPWKISWVKEDEKNWVLLANFDKGELRTYFKKVPTTKGLGLSHENNPVKQEFRFYFGQKFTSTKSQFEQWPDGAKCYAFTYDEKFERNGQKLVFGTTAIVEEVNGAKDEIRYALFRDFE
jgi:hypothetical protein